MFKRLELLSVPPGHVVKTMTSSGTTGQAVSRIFLDAATAALQTRALARIASDFLGPRRLPMLVIDSRSVLKDRRMFSARGAGILGFSMLGRDVAYALDDEMRLDGTAVDAFCRKHSGRPVLVFGFTFMVWDRFHKALEAAGKRVDLSGGILVHGGGWKKLRENAVDDETFKAGLRRTCGLQRVHNYYGMVEQTGSIFMQCDEGFLHCSDFSDVLVRDERLRPLPVGARGMLQVVSLLPRSYPGHSLLSEDVGRVLGVDDCPCGRWGRRFEVHGRLATAELRGCGDTFAAG